MWSGPIAQALRLANDLSPGICEGLALMRVTLVRVCRTYHRRWPRVADS